MQRRSWPMVKAVCPPARGWMRHNGVVGFLRRVCSPRRRGPSSVVSEDSFGESLSPPRRQPRSASPFHFPDSCAWTAMSSPALPLRRGRRALDRTSFYLPCYYMKERRNGMLPEISNDNSQTPILKSCWTRYFDLKTNTGL
jgi:hypothetical protein